MDNLATVTARIRAGEGSLGRLLADDAMARSLTSTTQNLDAITGRMDRGEGTLGQLATRRGSAESRDGDSERSEKVPEHPRESLLACARDDRWPTITKSLPAVW
jgi:hypothetical protein